MRPGSRLTRRWRTRSGTRAPLLGDLDVVGRAADPRRRERTQGSGRHRFGLGTITVAAAGNENTGPRSISRRASDDVIAVGASTDQRPGTRTTRTAAATSPWSRRRAGGSPTSTPPMSRLRAAGTTRRRAPTGWRPSSSAVRRPRRRSSPGSRRSCSRRTTLLHRDQVREILEGDRGEDRTRVRPQGSLDELRIRPGRRRCRGGRGEGGPK